MQPITCIIVNIIEGKIEADVNYLILEDIP